MENNLKYLVIQLFNPENTIIVPLNYQKNI